jgi:hypothetical protein
VAAGIRFAITSSQRRFSLENSGQIPSAVQKWARQVADWTNTPDLWDLDAEPLPDAGDNSQFTQPERDKIAKRLDEINDFVREHFELPDDQLAAIGQAVEELKEAS